MNDDRLDQRALELFDELCDLPAEQQDAELAARSGADDQLRSLVEAMLQEDRREDGPIPSAEFGKGADILAGDLADSAGAIGSMPESIGRYRLVREIARGGMGVVYEARQDNPARRVALKVVRQAFSTPQMLRRFRHEAEVLGRLDHAGIAQIFEAGSARLGQEEVPFFAMEYVDGLPLDRFIEERGLSTHETLELVARICDAVQHAHQRGVVHRDIKPANILVKSEATTQSGTGASGLIDAIGQPKVLDFGVARLTAPDARLLTLQTQAGQIIGTLAYMSPEQLDPTGQAIDSRSDVYALGVVLYRLLTGRPPHELSGVSLAEAARRLREDDPEPAGRHHPAFRGDIETIIAKAMDKEPDRRYASAAELSADLRRYCRNEPVEARPATTLYQLGKFARRNRGLVAGVAAGVLLLVVGVISASAGLLFALRANRALEQTNQELQRVTAFQESQLLSIDAQAMGASQRRHILEALDQADRDSVDTALSSVSFTDTARATIAENLLEPSLSAIDRQFENDPEVLVRMRATIVKIYRGMGLLDRADEVLAETLDSRAVGIPETHAVHQRLLLELGLLRMAQGRHEEAEAALRRRVGPIEALYGEQSLAAFNATANLGTALRRQGRFEEALELQRKAAESARAIGVPEADLLGLESMMASTLGEMGRLDESLNMKRDGYERRRELLGPDHDSTLVSMHNYASDLMSAGRLEQAEPIGRELVERTRARHGNAHPQTADALTLYGDTLAKLSRFAEAETIQRETLDVLIELFGPSHPDVALAANNLAASLDTQGQLDEAEQLYRRALEINESALGEDHPRTLMNVGNVGYVLNAMGRPEDAEPYYRRSYEGFSRAVGPDHPSALTSVGNLGALMLTLERFEEAELYTRESYERRNAVLGPTHPSTLNASYNLGNLLLKLERPNDAEPLVLAALHGYQAISPNHIGTLHSLGLVAKLRTGQDRLEDASAAWKEAAERRAAVLGESHPLTRDARDELSKLNPPPSLSSE